MEKVAMRFSVGDAVGPDHGSRAHRGYDDVLLFDDGYELLLLLLFILLLLFFRINFFFDDN